MARKTIDVSFVRERANAFLMLSEDEKQGERDGVIGLLVSVLHASDNYKGFSYIDGYPCEDETRRRYV